MINRREKKGQHVSKSKGAKATNWSHHDDMFINLKDWVARESLNLRSAMNAAHPELMSDPGIAKGFKDAESLATRMFEVFDSLVNIAERETNKKKKAGGDQTAAN